MHGGRILTQYRAFCAVDRLRWIWTLPESERNPLLRALGHICTAAVRGGHLEVLQWLRMNDCPWDEWYRTTNMICTLAAGGGHLKVLQWLRAIGCPWDEFTCRDAAEGGHLKVLQWLRANGCPWCDRTIALAASKGHSEVLWWARANGCDWDAYTCECAAVGGHLELLRELHERGCPWDYSTFKSAERIAKRRPNDSNAREILKYLTDNGCPSLPSFAVWNKICGDYEGSVADLGEDAQDLWEASWGEQ